MTERLRKAGTYQTMTMVVFLAAACLGGYALLTERYFLAAINGVLMIVNLHLWQTNGHIIREELERQQTVTKADAVRPAKSTPQSENINELSHQHR